MLKTKEEEAADLDVGDGSEAWLRKGVVVKVCTIDMIYMYISAYKYVLKKEEEEAAHLDVGDGSEAWLLKGVVVKVLYIWIHLHMNTC